MEMASKHTPFKLKCYPKGSGQWSNSEQKVRLHHGLTQAPTSVLCTSCHFFLHKLHNSQADFTETVGSVHSDGRLNPTQALQQVCLFWKMSALCFFSSFLHHDLVMTSIPREMEQDWEGASAPSGPLGHIRVSETAGRLVGAGEPHHTLSFF